MTSHDFATHERRILQILSDLTAVPVTEIGPQDRLREDLGLDSVGALELLSMLAEELQIDVEMEEVMGVDRVSSVMELARKHLCHVA